MKAILADDIILRLSSRVGTEIGRIPAGVGLERLRFDGRKVVDLADLATIHVRYVAGNFELHAIPVGDSQAVAMTYTDRRRLVFGDGVIRVKTSSEITADVSAEQQQIKKNQLRQSIKRDIGDTQDMLADMAKMLFATMVYARTGNLRLQVLIDRLVPEIKDIYPPDQVEQALVDGVKKLKEKMAKYYAE